MAEELLLEAEFESASNPPYGYSHIVPAQFALETGAEYRVVFDGAEYSCTGIDAAALGDGAVGIGNGAAFGLDGNGEPFCAGTFSGMAIVVCLLDTAPARHSITVYALVKEEGLVTENYDGSQTVHPGVETVSLYDTNGETQTFVHESLVAEPVEKTVELDFSAGAMAVTPEMGQVFSKVAIPVPANLAPENIAEGVNIAGIVGALAAGGGGGNVKIASGTTNVADAVDGVMTVTHNLGVVPDLVFVFHPSSSKPSFNGAIGFSLAFTNMMDFAAKYHVIGFNRSSSNALSVWSTYSEGRGIETFSAGSEPISAATATTFCYGKASTPVNGAGFGNWLAIGGLT